MRTFRGMTITRGEGSGCLGEGRRPDTVRWGHRSRVVDGETAERVEGSGGKEGGWSSLGEYKELG